MNPTEQGGALRLRFDAARCDGWGMCAVVFPEGISLDPWGFALVGGDPLTDRVLQRKARRAVRGCPRRALALVVADAGAGRPTTGSRQEPQ